jgi:two-component system cell cycle sensor histidine kinase/response regulator CckA
VSPYAIAPGSYIKLTVEDAGVGMSSETLQRIFDPFFTTKEVGRGTGLGLASVYGIVKNHGGFVTVHSELGEGTAFFVYLPATYKPLAADQVPAITAHGHGETILVVDDEEHIVRTSSKLLEAMGYRVLKAYSGQEAVEIVQRNPKKVSLVILDLIMPAMGGSQTFDALRKVDPSIKVILSSGYSIEGEATELLARGCNGFIQKPFTVASLSEKIRKVL